MKRPRIGVLVVDDSPRVRHLIRRCVDALPGCRVIGTAGNGREAIGRTLALSPDVVLLDIEMPEMDGFGYLRWILPNRPLPVIVVSARDDRDSVFRFLEAGAVDFLSKPAAESEEDLRRFGRELALRLDALPGLRLDRLSRIPPRIRPPASAGTAGWHGLCREEDGEGAYRWR